MFSDTDYTARFYEALGKVRTGLLDLAGTPVDRHEEVSLT